MAAKEVQFSKDKTQALICALCLEVYRNPKLLPCHHTFCESCLERLAVAGGFPCPSCRKHADLPPGGVSSLQNNFYIDSDDLEKARYGLFCTVHCFRDLELFCRDCDKPICLKCKITDHEAHTTSDLHTTAVPAIKEKQAVEDKRDVLKNVILNREAILKAAAEKLRDEALTSLDKTTDEILETLTSSWLKTICRPVLRFNVSANDTLQRMRDYLGSAMKMEMAVSAPEVTVVEKFRCREDPDTDVSCVCPLTDDNVVVSYASRIICENVSSEAACEVFHKDGKSVGNPAMGKFTLVRNGSDKYMYIETDAEKIITFAKKCEPDMINFLKLSNDLQGHAIIYSEKITSEDSFQTELRAIFTINCAAHRAFDADATEQLFAVLEEGKTPDLQRRVQLYRRTQPDAIATYSPPVAPFQPSDVCFYVLGGQEVLLVADELNDAIHVVNVQDGRLSFARYLSPGCPLLVQPTALNTDMRGRLWVACRGGRILTCTPIKSNQH